MNGCVYRFPEDQCDGRCLISGELDLIKTKVNKKGNARQTRVVIAFRCGHEEQEARTARRSDETGGKMGGGGPSEGLKGSRGRRGTRERSRDVKKGMGGSKSARIELGLWSISRSPTTDA